MCLFKKYLWLLIYVFLNEQPAVFSHQLVLNENVLLV